jgi:hypothetical protein
MPTGSLLLSFKYSEMDTVFPRSPIFIFPTSLPNDPDPFLINTECVAFHVPSRLVRSKNCKLFSGFGKQDVIKDTRF